MFPKRRLIVLTVVISAFATVLAPSAQADWPATTCVDGSTPIGNSSFVSGGTANVTLSVGGVTQNNVTQTYIAEVCKDSGSGLYNYMVGLKTGSTISESGNSAPSTYRNGTDTIILSFTLSNGDVPKMVEGYGNISDFAISGQRVTITGTPGALTQVNYGGSSPYIACQSAPYTGTYGGGQSCAAIPCYDPATLTGDSNCVDDLATFHGAVRGPNGGVDKTGMWISSAANLYAVGLNNCASLKTRARHGHRVTRDDGGANRPSPDISVQMVGPHYMTNGDYNYGNIHAFIPFAVIQNCFGTDTASFAQSVGVTRQEGGADTALVSGAGFTATPTVGGLLITVPRVGFSSPTYKIAGPRAASSGGTSSGGADSTGSSASTGSTPRIAGVSWKGAKGKAIASFAPGKTVKSYAIKATLKGKSKTGSCKITAKKVTCTVKGLSPGPWVASVTSKLKTGGSGPTASNTVPVK